MKLSKKQINLLNDIISPNLPEIYVLGSTQSGKTYDIALALINYASELNKYDPVKQYSGAIIGWSIETLKGNIVDVLEQHLQAIGLRKKEKGIGDYELRWGGGDERYLKIYNIKFYFFGFNTYLSFNKILGKPLIFVWVDESARIYSQSQLQEPFNEIPGRQMSFADHPYLKTIHSFNVEGNENHPYKRDYIDKKPYAKHYTFFPYDNPVIQTKEAISKVLELFPPGSLREQKVYCKWVVATGRVFSKINIIDNLSNYIFREIGIGIDYGSVHTTAFVPIALVYEKTSKSWKIIRLQTYYHNPKDCNDTPTTEYFSNQLRLFLVYLKNKYPHVPITTIVLDSAAAHFHNRLITDNIPHDLTDKGPGSVDEGIQYMQSLFEKEYLLIYKENSIRHIYNNGQVELCGKDEGILELEGYQYDSIKSENSGVNCYKKEYDDFVDAFRYIITEFKETNRAPIV